MDYIMWSDGCVGQLKSSKAFYFVAHYPSLAKYKALPNGCQLVWKFLTTRHGKGEVDGVGALLKQEVEKE